MSRQKRAKVLQDLWDSERADHVDTEDVGFPPPSSPTSCSSSGPGGNYDVFLSFRGEDTRNTFVGHLYKALDRYGIYTFKDDEKLKRGKSISPELLKAIQDSIFSIVVLSENYATSSWCLDELVKIIECMDQFGHTVVPIFYRVDPSHVKKQTGSFAKAFAEHEKAFEKEKEKVLRWRGALTRVATISGWNSQDRDEAVLIEQIVGDISGRLFSGSSSDDSKLVGMDYHIKQMYSLLCIGSSDVHMVGIWGMGGIGKTTIASTIYDMFARQYEGRCFIANVRDIFEKHGPTFLQEKLLSEILLERNIKIGTREEGLNMIKKRLCRKKVFIVLDDVDNLVQLETLAGKRYWFGPESRIIIMTRDKHLLATHGVKYIYAVENLKDGKARQLFLQYAFKQHRLTADYLMLSNQIVSYTKGLPLALKVLGSFLYSKSIIEWKSELNKLQRIPNVEIQNVLRVSYDRLDDEQKDIFLDIACFFKGEDKDSVMNILDSCGFFPDTGLRVLIDKSLVTISDNQLCMHDLVQEMGWEVVRQESVKEPGKRSRLWFPEDVYHVLKKNTGTKAVESIFFDTSKIEEAKLSPDAFMRMQNLRLLKIFDSNAYEGFKENCKVNLPQGLESLPEGLRYLYWHKFPLTSLPSNFPLKNLVEINMPYSKLERLWEGVECLPKLKRVDLSHSRHLKEIPDLSKAQNLDSIILKDCTSLFEVCSCCGLKSLKYVTLSGCPEPKMFPGDLWDERHDLSFHGCKCGDSTGLLLPRLSGLSSLTDLDLSDCNLLEFPQGLCCLSSLKFLNLGGNFFESVPAEIKHLYSLERLTLRACKKLRTAALELPSRIRTIDACDCTSLEAISISSCEPRGWVCVTTEFGRHAFRLTNCFKLNLNLANKPFYSSVLGQAFPSALESEFASLLQSRKGRPIPPCERKKHSYDIYIHLYINVQEHSRQRERTKKRQEYIRQRYPFWRDLLLLREGVGFGLAM